jgi:hypothetical protein
MLISYHLICENIKQNITYLHLLFKTILPPTQNMFLGFCFHIHIRLYVIIIFVT